MGRGAGWWRLATMTAAPKGSGVAEHGNLFDGRSSFPTPKRTENILCLRACLRGGCVPAQGSLFPNPPLRSRFGWGCLAQRLRLEAYPWPARSTECTQDCIERGDMNLLCERGRVGANAREGGISERLHAKRKRRWSAPAQDPSARCPRSTLIAKHMCNSKRLDVW